MGQTLGRGGYTMRFFMQHWAQDYWRDQARADGDEGAPFSHTASNQFGPLGLEAGDRLYVVGAEDGQLLLIGVMDVAHVVRTAEAARLMGTSGLYEREWHAIANPPLQPLSFARRVPEKIARAIRTEEGKALKIDPSAYRIPPMALVRGRFLSPDSAALLDALMTGGPAETEEIRDVEATARGRSYGRQRSAAQRKAIEHHAVHAATRHFEHDGWAVEDVGLWCPYDLHCTKGRRTLHVEVKGTTGALGTVALTAGEVADALQHHPHTALFVLHHIELQGTPSRPRTVGGDAYVEQPWSPKRSRLTPVAYSYRLT